jgi:hypothetical protein
MSLLWVRMWASFTKTLITEESSRYWPRLPIAIPLPPWQVICSQRISKKKGWNQKETYVLDEDVVGPWFYGYAIVATLVYHVRKLYVVGVHRVEAVGVLHPICAVRGVHCCCVVEDVVEPHVCSVHDVQGPEGRVLDVD